MRICLAVPSIQDFYFSRERVSSLGARTVVGLIESTEHTCALFDFPSLVKKARSVGLPGELAYLRPFLLPETGPVTFFTGYQRLGPPPEECARLLVASDPDILLISCFAYGYAGDAIDLAGEIKAIAPNMPIAVGGAGATVLPEKFMMSGLFEFVLSGAAEISLLVFLNEFDSGHPRYERVPSLVWQADGAIQHSEKGGFTAGGDLRWVCHVDDSRRGRTRLSTSLSRGCPRRCSFCSNHLCHGRSYRKLPLELVRTGFAAVSPGPGMHVNFEDDNLLADTEYFMAVIGFAREIFDGPSFSAENGLDAGFLDEELLERLVLLGFGSFNFSLGSIDEEILRQENRSPSSSRIAVLTRHSASLGVPSVTYFICGLPGDTAETIVESLLFLHSLPTKIGISLFYPVPGLPGFEDAKPFLSRPPRLACGSSGFPWNGSLSTRQLVTAFRLARLVNLLGDSNQSTIHSDLLAAIRKEKRLYTWSRKGKELLPVPGLDDDLVRVILSEICC